MNELTSSTFSRLVMASSNDISLSSNSLQLAVDDTNDVDMVTSMLLFRFFYRRFLTLFAFRRNFFCPTLGKVVHRE